MTKLAIGIPTCVFPTGCRALLKNLLDYTPAGEYEVFVLLDGNEGWARLDQTDRYRKQFGFFDRGSGWNDARRFERINQSCPDYSFLADVPPHVHVLHHEENRGYVAGYNTLCRAAGDAEFITILNDDLSVFADWLSPLLGAFTLTEYVAMVAYANWDPDNKRKIVDSEPMADFFGSGRMVKGDYVRLLLRERGYVEDPKFKMIQGDIGCIFEVMPKGFDIVSVGSPIRMHHMDHQSLGHWQLAGMGEDGKKEITYSHPTGRSGNWIRAVLINGEWKR